MGAFNLEGAGRPEAQLQEKIIEFLQRRGWHVMPTHGNMYQKGFPDLFICHHDYGHRWVEVKLPDIWGFTPAQEENFPLICRNGSGVWIMTGANDIEYKKLWHPPNWHHYYVLLKRKCR